MVADVDEAVTGPDVDTGLFGPDSVTWRLHAEPVLWIGGIRALYLQALHPLAMAGIADHSDFRSDPWGRLRRTAAYVGVLTYGTTEEARDAVRHVNRAHRGLSGVEPETGRSYRVADPELLLWVHCCQVDSFLGVLRRAGVPVSAHDADAYVAEQVLAAELVGVPSDRVPSSSAALAAYLERMRPELRCTAAATRAARFLLMPPMRWSVQVLTPARPAWTYLALVAFASQPAWARRMYASGGSLPASRLVDGGATLASRGLARTLSLLPAGWREGPHLRAARRRLAS